MHMSSHQPPQPCSKKSSIQPHIFTILRQELTHPGSEYLALCACVKYQSPEKVVRRGKTSRSDVTDYHLGGVGDLEVWRSTRLEGVAALNGQVSLRVADGVGDVVDDTDAEAEER